MLDLESLPRQKRLMHHQLKHTQHIPVDVTEIAHDEEFFQMQLLRAISIASAAAGFVGVDPAALESFRALTEEYMLRFLSHVRISMNACRRVQPIPQDFTFALAKGDLRSSLLLPHIKLPVCSSTTQPPLRPPSPEEPPPPPLEKLLGPDLVETELKSRKQWIPSHFPNLPSKHTWEETPTFAKRETEPLKIREMATQQGILAEKALRKLISVGKSSSADGRAKENGKSEDRKVISHKEKYEKIWEDTFQALAMEDEKAQAQAQARAVEVGSEMDIDFEGEENMPVTSKTTPAITPDTRIVVNYDKKYWRKGMSSALRI